MSPAAQDASRDFVGIAGDVGATIQFDSLLRHGFEAFSPGLQSRFPGLAQWKGVNALKRSLSSMAGLESGLPVLLAGRSAQLMKLAAILLCRPCENILVTDLGWPEYHRILAAECQRTSRRMTSVPLLAEILDGQLNEDEVIDRILAAYRENDCDGLFLTAVSNLGVRLPVQRLYRVIAATRRVRFVVVDGAQDFRHISSDLSEDCCDLYLAGCHKWLGAYNPLALAFYGRRRSRSLIERVLAETIDSRTVDDPLLRFTEELCGQKSRDDRETVNLAPLFSCQGAVCDALPERPFGNELHARVQNASRIAETAASTGWMPRQPHDTLQSGILLLQADRLKTRQRSSDDLRKAFHGCGVALTAYDDGLVRLSMPAWNLEHHELTLLETALHRVA